MRTRQQVLVQGSGADLSALADIDPQLVLVFAAPQRFVDPDWLPALRRQLPAAQFAGCSTAGEISQGGVLQDMVVLTAVHFDAVEFRIEAEDMAGPEDSSGVGQRLGARLAGFAPRAVLVFGPGVGINGSELIAGLVQSLGPEVLLTGGLAADNGAFVRTWTLCEERVGDRQVVAIGLRGPGLRIGHGSFGGWQSFGPVRRVTRARGNVLFELDGKPALEVYRRYLGEYAAGLPATGLLFPFSLMRNEGEESGIIRTLLAVDAEAGSLTLAGDVPEGCFLRLMSASTEALVDGAEAAAEAAQGAASESGGSLALLVSCIGRKLVMGDRVDEEVEAVGAVFGRDCSLAGFYSNGEISPFHLSTDCRLHNQTMTITRIAEA